MKRCLQLCKISHHYQPTHGSSSISLLQLNINRSCFPQTSRIHLSSVPDLGVCLTLLEKAMPVANALKENEKRLTESFTSRAILHFAYVLLFFDHGYRAGLKPTQPMQLHWTPRHGVWVNCSFLPDTPCT